MELFCAISHKNDGWFVMKGVLKSKEEVNLWDPEKPISFEKLKTFPACIQDTGQQKHDEFVDEKLQSLTSVFPVGSVSQMEPLS